MLIVKIFIVIAVAALIELCCFLLVKGLRKRFQWLITPDDEFPELDKAGLDKFFKHGYDPELGWVRKPNTSHAEKAKRGKVTYHIDEKGARIHPGYNNLKPLIACYGDSFTFSRQVADDETWPYYISKLAGVGVLNFGVGNYGVDQAYLRMTGEIKDNKTDITIMGVVPSTIVRVLSIWKHYNEFGNTFGFKPRFDIKDGKLFYIKNIIDNRSKFDHYKDYIDQIRANDYFYMTKFRDEMIRFPYSLSILRKPGRNIRIIASVLFSLLLGALGKKVDFWDTHAMKVIMQVNFRLRYNLFHNEYARRLLKEIIRHYAELAKGKGSVPVFVLLPQKDDVLFAKEKGSYYGDFMNDISKMLFTIDMTDHLANAENLVELYSEDSDYGGHHSPEGNRFIAEQIIRGLIGEGILHPDNADIPSLNEGMLVK